jgi:hypothetical protein
MRTLNRVLAVLLALALLVLGVLVAVEVAHSALGRPGHLVLPYEPLARFGRERSWGSAPVLAITAGTLVLGLLLLVAQLVPRRPGLLTVATGDPAVVAGIARRPLSRALAAAATDVDGISRATATVRKRRARVVATSLVRDTTGLPERTQRHLQEWVDGLGLVQAPSLHVQVKQKGR